ncbi:hypothetical protein Esi_0015_0219 [Ectocarpus siliculosus]|uniref:Uncharacterized protein n=1 Tax=Ectocarpus siliculosus TaxID=2880 RepID=D8LFN0_ECTSI|nr:hypothetical protein Esi_0015_0219 [Ectocarpus siliculosus]|eukprot:CBN79950.1 hypothetical protein Esi_0015_0219 [Ectocarpus siliculosus]
MGSNHRQSLLKQIYVCGDRNSGPELRQGLDLFRVINRTGLQIRRGVGLNSEPCGRLFAGDVFCVNRCSAVPHHQENKRGKMRQLRLTRLHMVQPYTGWVTWSSKWVEKFQGGDTRPGPIPLKSTLRDNCPVSMVKPSDACPVRRGASSRDGVWPVDVKSIPGPKYLPSVSGANRDHSSAEYGVVFPKERRFLSNSTRRQPVSSTTAAGAGSPYIGLKEQEAADKIVGKANAGTTGCPVIRTLVSSRGEREGPDGCFVTRMGAESPGPTSGERNGSRRGLAERVARYIPLQSIKIVVVAWQIVTQIAQGRGGGNTAGGARTSGGGGATSAGGPGGARQNGVAPQNAVALDQADGAAAGAAGGGGSANDAVRGAGALSLPEVANLALQTTVGDTSTPTEDTTSL